MTTLEQFWRACRAHLGEPNLPQAPYVAEQFGDSSELADELGRLIVEGVKTATCSALLEWEAEGRAPPQPGERMIVLDGQDMPLCLIETSEVEIRSFDDVDAQFAYDEGENDRSLESWRQAHWSYFLRVLKPLGLEPVENMLLVCERFRVLFVP